ncbi:hypothetical protein F5B22DRAFT_648628 [Xylaria bambusicola]|uniref:uncharacterized protein n=1 Tax=Xylaria bambusicola TaxID=326684 RepID=UPI0020080CF7|nr:uncharacterized protein F5B22DRAFT_648628 [Xylaria bambusicola]KAI0512525.1 hypothetical protein F5B22DRAFT_648628 [Xylaria bambusicola]
MTNSEEIFQSVFIYPRPEKWELVKTLMKDIAEYVRANEPGTLVYAVHECTKDPNSPVLVVWEKYQDKAARARHQQNPGLAELLRHNEADALIRQPFEIMPLAPMAGKVP